MKEPQQNQNKVLTGPETGRQTKVRPKCVKRETIKIETKMKKQMKRTVYEAPLTERFQVELEGTFCGSADVENPETQQDKVGEIGTHGVEGTMSDFSDSFSSDGWQ